MDQLHRGAQRDAVENKKTEVRGPGRFAGMIRCAWRVHDS
jgi:hypothetical protein